MYKVYVVTWLCSFSNLHVSHFFYNPFDPFLQRNDRHLSHVLQLKMASYIRHAIEAHWQAVVLHATLVVIAAACTMRYIVRWKIVQTSALHPLGGAAAPGSRMTPFHVIVQVCRHVYMPFIRITCLCVLYPLHPTFI